MKLSLKRVQLTCAVKGCTNVEDGMPLDRHHVRSQKMWVSAFAIHAYIPRLRSRYLRFRERYEEFRECDLVRLCREHHEEVHDMYYDRVNKWMDKFRCGLSSMTWDQAEQIMQDLEREFHKWLKRKNSKPRKSFFRTLRPNS